MTGESAAVVEFGAHGSDDVNRDTDVGEGLALKHLLGDSRVYDGIGFGNRSPGK